MKETKQAPAHGAPNDARGALRAMMGAFEAFKQVNDARLAEIEKKASADVLLEEKVARIDQAMSRAQSRLDRIAGQSRRPEVGTAVPVTAPEAKAAWAGYMKTGAAAAGFAGLELKAGLSTGSGSGALPRPDLRQALGDLPGRVRQRRQFPGLSGHSGRRLPDGLAGGRRASLRRSPSGVCRWSGGPGRKAGRRAAPCSPRSRP